MATDEVLTWGGPDARLGTDDLAAAIDAVIERYGPATRVMAVPPDFSRYHSRAGDLTAIVHRKLGARLTDVLPALGTHRPLTQREREAMFPGVPESLFRVHNWRTDLVDLGEIPGDFVREVSEGRVDYAWPAQLNRSVATGGHDLILSIGQVVPHEVIGMANHAKNLFIGTGGRDAINKSHFLGAVYGMERIMGRADSPVRAVINAAAERFLTHLPIVYVLTVIGPARPDEREDPNVKDGLATRGVFASRGLECFYRAAELALQVNFTMVDQAPEHVIAYLDPQEFHSTWLGNKSIYRTRMMIADGGHLTVLAPGVETFGEDPGIDKLIRRHGYCGTDATLTAVAEDSEMAADLGAAAHLIHGSSEGRFTIEYCPGGLTAAEIEGVGFRYGDLAAKERELGVAALHDGWNTLADGSRAYYVSHPALGLWAHASRFHTAAP